MVLPDTRLELEEEALSSPQSLELLRCCPFALEGRAGSLFPAAEGVVVVRIERHSNWAEEEEAAQRAASREEGAEGPFASWREQHLLVNVAREASLVRVAPEDGAFVVAPPAAAALTSHHLAA